MTVTECARFGCFLHARVPILMAFETIPGSWHGENDAGVAGVREGRFGTEAVGLCRGPSEYYEGRKK